MRVIQSLRKLGLKSNHEPADKEVMEVLIRLETGGEKYCLSLHEDALKEYWQYKALVIRSEEVLLSEFDKRIYFTILLVCNGNIGSMIQLMYFLQVYCHDNNLESLTWKQFCQEVFPWGFPKRKVMDEVWNECKVHRLSNYDLKGTEYLLTLEGGSDNGIDHSELCKEFIY